MGGPAVGITFDRPTTDEELQSLVDPEGHPPYLRLEDDGTTLTARPRPIPPGCVWGWLGLTAAGMYLMMWWFGALPLRGPAPLGDGLTPFLVLFFLPASCLACGAIANWAFARPLGRGPFFTLDRAAGTLTLLRTGAVLRPGDVAELVEVRGWHTVRSDDGSSSDRVAELTALARNPDGTLARHSVVVCEHHAPVRRVTAELAAFFGVPSRRLVAPLFFGKRWRRADQARMSLTTAPWTSVRR
jgi:hypothetical protein